MRGFSTTLIGLLLVASCTVQAGQVIGPIQPGKGVHPGNVGKCWEAQECPVGVWCTSKEVPCTTVQAVDLEYWGPTEYMGPIMVCNKYSECEPRKEILHKLACYQRMQEAMTVMDRWLDDARLGNVTFQGGIYPNVKKHWDATMRECAR